MRTALIIIDVQRSLIEDETWQPERVLDRVCGLEATARVAGAPIFYVADSRVAPHAELHARLSPRECDLKITKANCDSFLDTILQEELAATENKVGFARQFYNDIATKYNIARETFPSNLIAGSLGFTQAELFEITDEAERQVPTVDLSMKKT